MDATMADEGYKSINEVCYAYKFLSRQWFGAFECRVHGFFCTSPTEIYTEIFYIGGHAWQLRLIHKEDGNLGVYVYSRSPEAPPIRFSFAVVSHKAIKPSTYWGDFHTIPDGQCWGFRKLTTIDAIKDSSSGFLLGDVFTVRLDLRLRLEENERFSVHTIDSKHAQIIWSLKNVGSMGPWVFVSDEFSIGDSKWQLQFYPKGQKHDLSHSSIFLYTHNNSSIKAKLRVSCINNMLRSDDISRNLEYTFTDHNEGRGWFQFIETKAIEVSDYGFLDDGWITIQSDIRIECQQGVVNQPVVPPAGCTNNDDGPACVICLGRTQTSGVLHGETTHKCFCLDCARMLKDRGEDINCPICGEKAERIIEKFY